MRLVCSVLIILSLVFPAPAQKTVLDSTNIILQQKIPDSTKVLLLCDMAKNVQLTDTIRCNNYLQAALAICKRTGYNYGYGKVYLQQGKLHGFTQCL